MLAGEGPWVWVPPEGCNLVAETPEEVRIMDIEGEQQGAHHWAGLHSIMEELLKSFWSKTPWPGHACDICRRTVIVDEEERTIRAAVIDGCNNTRHPKCKVYECPRGLKRGAGAR